MNVWLGGTIMQKKKALASQEEKKEYGRPGTQDNRTRKVISEGQ